MKPHLSIPAFTLSNICLICMSFRPSIAVSTQADFHISKWGEELHLSVAGSNWNNWNTLWDPLSLLKMWNGLSGSRFLSRCKHYMMWSVAVLTWNGVNSRKKFHPKQYINCEFYNLRKLTIYLVCLWPDFLQNNFMNQIYFNLISIRLIHQIYIES